MTNLVPTHPTGTAERNRRWPAVLALIGVVSAGTAVAWATTLHVQGAWWFRLAVLAGLVWWAPRRRNQCSPAGVRRLVAAFGIAVATRAVLDAVTTWWGSVR
jgi:hypothetical protein